MRPSSNQRGSRLAALPLGLPAAGGLSRTVSFLFAFMFVSSMAGTVMAATGEAAANPAERTPTLSAEPLPESIAFNRDVRPILSDKCFACHGFDSAKRKADLRLDTPEGAEASGTLVPGAPDESELWLRVSHTDPDETMPPAETGKSLDDRELAILRRWIEEGAAYEPHWSYVPPRRPDLPVHSSAAIDHLVDRELQRRGLTRSPEASRVTLLRRLSFDLTGLPPTPDEVAAFESDERPDAYARVVERLLASPHFGERMAISWLDVVRYADTVGFHGDQPVSVSPYRDYVIRSFNENLPFDQFTREQLAGDLLPSASLRQRVASGYNRLNITTEEGGSQAKEYLLKYASDRVRTTATAWLGATLACAECHDHKFDPYTMRDFYSFAAFFADIEEVGVYGNRGRPPEIAVLSPEDETRLATLEAELLATRREIDEKAGAEGDERHAWEARMIADADLRVPYDLVWLDDDPPAGASVSGAWNAVTGERHPVHGGEQARLQEADGMVQHYFNDAAQPLFIDEGDRFFVHVWLDPSNPPRALMLQAHSNAADTWNHRAFWGEDLITYGGIGSDSPAHRPAGPLPDKGRWVRLEVAAADLGFTPGQSIDGFSFDQFGGRAFWDTAGVAARSMTPVFKTFSGEARTALFKAAEARTAEEAVMLDGIYRAHSPLLHPLHEKASSLERQIAELREAGTRTLVTVAVPPRETRILPRGDWMDESGPVVQPQIPEFLGRLEPPASGRLDRRHLAEWLVADENPLTARVFVNRLWKELFGNGLSKVLDDLGSQGEWPSHPALLDWLAAEFVESGWNVKHLVRVIVESETYRQDSRPDPALAARDPGNRLLARQARLRLPAELVRDNALAVSGLLVDRIGGASAKPYQPGGYYRHLNFPKREYEADKDENQWRRGLYTHWQRTFLHPMLMAFDAPSRDECAANRPISNTPTQALVLLNDPTFVEAARVLADRILLEAGTEENARLDYVFRTVLSRLPRTDERAALHELLAAERKEFSTDPAAAARLASVGISPSRDDLDPVELAAWTSVARVVMNLHEFVIRP